MRSIIFLILLTFVVGCVESKPKVEGDASFSGLMTVHLEANARGQFTLMPDLVLTVEIDGEQSTEVIRRCSISYRNMGCEFAMPRRSVKAGDEITITFEENCLWFFGGCAGDAVEKTFIVNGPADVAQDSGMTEKTKYELAVRVDPKGGA